MDIKAKKALTVISLILLIAVYCMIFALSADYGEESSNISRAVTGLFWRVYYSLFVGEGYGEAVITAVNNTEDIVRKIAHFMEYMTVGFLSFGIVVMWSDRLRKWFLIVLGQLVISAALDEFHQYFVPGRYASVKDVLIDTAGGVTGIAVILFFLFLGRLMHRRRKI